MIGRDPDSEAGGLGDEPLTDEPLSDVELRVLGCLMEKELTVPATYPLTLNALVTAANQSSGRNPIMELGAGEVTAALDRLRERSLIRRVYPRSGERREKFRQVADEVLELSGGSRAVLTLLMLRGPQTPGELRSRSGRLHDFGELAEVEDALRQLAGRTTPLVVELERRPGRRENRWAHLLGTGVDREDSSDAPVPTAEPPRTAAVASNAASRSPTPPAPQAPPMSPALDPFRPLLGRWQGGGVGEYPTIDDFEYTETITFAPLADKPVIAYTSTTKHAADGRPLHAETGYLRVLNESTVELVVAQAPGLIEAGSGIATHPGGADDRHAIRLAIDSTVVAGTPSAKEVTATERRYLVTGDRLEYDLAMAAVGLPMTHHLTAELKRVG
ncbi:MAG: DUF480 domain-containing protein [Microthrixaceae bacterium]